MTHEERRQRRRDIADFCRKGHSVEEAAQKFHVGIPTASEACRENGYYPGKRGPHEVGLPRKGKKLRVAYGSFRVLAALQQRKPDESHADVARRLNKKYRYVSYVKRQAEEAGLWIPGVTKKKT